MASWQVRSSPVGLFVRSSKPGSVHSLCLSTRCVIGARTAFSLSQQGSSRRKLYTAMEIPNGARREAVKTSNRAAWDWDKHMT